MEPNSIGKKIIKGADEAVNIAVLILLLILLFFGVYALWDSRQVYQAAAAANYTVYKPKQNDSLTFAQLQAINPEIFAWITVNGTGIDYPVAQSTDDAKYIFTNAKGDYSPSGCPFLDSLNDRHFTDFNNIIYGHHMTGGLMFGDLEKFKDEAFFNSHPYGNLYYDGVNHGIQFFAFLDVNAYDHTIYNPDIIGNTASQTYIGYLYGRAIWSRNIGVTPGDHLVLLSTCANDATNGRMILAGRITDQTYTDSSGGSEDPGFFQSLWQKIGGFLKKIPFQIWVIIWIILLIILAWIIYRIVKHRKEKQQPTEKTNKEKDKDPPGGPHHR